MNKAGTWLSPDEWYRVGRGSSVDIPGLRNADITLLIEALPSEYRPYLLVASYPEKCGRHFIDRLEVVDPAGIGGYVDRGVWSFWIVSEVLSPVTADDLDLLDGRTLSLSGAVGLQHGRTTQRMGLQPTSLGHVRAVANIAGERVSFPGYSLVFAAAVKAARRLAAGSG